MPVITSFRNPLIKRIKRLRRKKHRRREEAFFIEGIRVVLSALEQDAPIETLVYAPDLLTSDVAWEAIAVQKAAGADIAELSADLFASISERENPVGLGAVVHTQLRTLAELAVAADDILVAAKDLSDPGNLGTLVRTLDGVGAAGLILVGQTTDPFHPTAVKASMGALFTVPVCAVDRMDDLWTWAQHRRLFTVATSARARENFWEAGYRFPALLLLGSEGEGLSAEVLQRAQQAVSIPMYGRASSLNLSVAAGLLLYELRRAQLR
jgi:TrmH family RNA methyltransferase